MNGFTLCAHDVIKLVLVLGTLFTVLGMWTGTMVLIARYGAH